MMTVSDVDWDFNNYKFIDNGHVLLDYSKILLPRAIENSAAVIDLFFREAKKEPPVELSDDRINLKGILMNSLSSVVDLAQAIKNRWFGSEKIAMPDFSQAAEIQELRGAEKKDNITEESIAETSPTVILSASEESINNQSTDGATNDDQSLESKDEIYLVQRVIDGDTFEIEINGKKQSVRLIGIDTPERNRCFFEESTTKAKELLLNKKVKLVKDPVVSSTDQYGRWLRYAYRQDDELFFNYEMIKNGYAREYNFKGLGYDFVAEFSRQENRARDLGLGLWSACYEKETAGASNTQDVRGQTSGVGGYPYSSGGSTSSGGRGGGNNTSSDSSNSNSDSGGEDEDNTEEESGASGGDNGQEGGENDGSSSDSEQEKNNSIQAPILDPSFSNIIYTNTSSIGIFGLTSTGTSEILTCHSTSVIESFAECSYLNSYLSSDQVDWSFHFSLESGHNYFYFKAQDSEGNTSSLTNPAHIIFDNQAPTVPELIIENNSGFNSAEILLFTSSTDNLSPQIYYDFAYSTNTLNWVEFAVLAGNDVSFAGERGQQYYFSARAQDLAGNYSAWSFITSSSTAPIALNPSQEVVFNEIDWSGVSGDYNARQWIELYNNTPEDIDLSDWKIYVSGQEASFKEIKNNIIPANGYYILEMGRDNTVPYVVADRILSSPKLNVSGEKLELKNPVGDLIDIVDCSPTAGGWFAGSLSNPYQSMERINSKISGNDKNNWQSNQGARLVNLTSGSSFNIYASPKLPNFGYIFLNGVQQQELMVLTPSGNPYILGNYEVPAGKTLQIDPGVVIKSNNTGSYIKVYGNLEVNGEEEEKIYLTSGRDLAVPLAVDKIGNYDSEEPQSGDWGGIFFYEGANGIFNNFEMRYAGAQYKASSLPTTYYEAGIYARDVSLQINNSTFLDIAPDVLNLEYTPAVINDSQFIGGDRALYSRYAKLEINNTSFSNFQNENGPVDIRDYYPENSGLVLMDNFSDVFFLNGTEIIDDTVFDPNLDYLITVIRTNTSTKLTIPAGVDLKMKSYGVVEINGDLDILGTIGAPVNIEPVNTSSQWASIVLNNSDFNFQNVNIDGGGLWPHTRIGSRAPVIVENSNLSFNNVSMRDVFGTTRFVHAENSHLTFSNVSIGSTVKKYEMPNEAQNEVWGIELNDGSLNISDSFIYNVNMGIWGGTSGDFMPAFNYNNLNFENVDIEIWPNPWISITTSTE